MKETQFLSHVADKAHDGTVAGGSTAETAYYAGIEDLARYLATGKIMTTMLRTVVTAATRQGDQHA